MRRFSKGRMMGKAIGICFLIIIGTFVISGIVMLLWNHLMPDIFHLPVITLWQALGLLILSKILFGGFRGGPRQHFKDKMREKMRQKWMNMPPEEREKMKERMKQRWTNMTPEEIEKFKQNWRRRCRSPFDKEDFFSGGDPFDPRGPFGPDQPFPENDPFSNKPNSSTEKPS
jgi:hypothetical protein